MRVPGAVFSIFFVSDATPAWTVQSGRAQRTSELLPCVAFFEDCVRSRCDIVAKSCFWVYSNGKRCSRATYPNGAMSLADRRSRVTYVRENISGHRRLVDPVAFMLTHRQATMQKFLKSHKYQAVAGYQANSSYDHAVFGSYFSTKQDNHV